MNKTELIQKINAKVSEIASDRVYAIKAEIHQVKGGVAMAEEILVNDLPEGEYLIPADGTENSCGYDAEDHIKVNGNTYRISIVADVYAELAKYGVKEAREAKLWKSGSNVRIYFKLSLSTVFYLDCVTQKFNEKGLNRIYSRL